LIPNGKLRFKILNTSYPSYWMVLPLFFPIGWLGVLLCIFMMAAAESVIYYTHHKGS
jgi:hypothetical protein